MLPHCGTKILDSHLILPENMRAQIYNVIRVDSTYQITVTVLFLLPRAKSTTVPRWTCGPSASYCTPSSPAACPSTVPRSASSGNACSGASTAYLSTCRPTAKTCSRSSWCLTRPRGPVSSRSCGTSG